MGVWEGSTWNGPGPPRSTRSALTSTFHEERKAIDPTPHSSDLRPALQRGLSELSREASPDQVESLLALVALLSSWSIRMNLTGHREPGRALRGLVLESVALLGVLPSFRSAVDLGSGAGFPGLPWAILHPERRVVLVESRERRHHFQRAAIRQLGLSNVVSLRGRLEEIDPEPVDAVVAQAVGPARSIIPMMLPWARLGGFVAIPCGPNPPEIGQVAGLGEAHFLPYRVPLGGPARGVWIADRDS